MRTKSITKKTGLTRQGVNFKRRRGESDAEIIAGHGTSDASGETLASAQLRKEKALADLRELEVAQKSGSLVSLDHAVLAGAAMAQMTRQRMSTIPGALAGVLGATTDEREIRTILDAEISRQLEHLSNDFLSAADEGIADGRSPQGAPEDDETHDAKPITPKPKSKPQPATGGPHKGKS